MGESWIQPKIHHFNLSQWLFQSTETSLSPFSPSVPLLSPFFPPCLFRNHPWGGKRRLQPQMGLLPQRENCWKNPLVPQKSLGLREQEPSWPMVVLFGGQGMGRTAPDPEGLSCPRAQHGRNGENSNVELNPSGSIQAAQLKGEMMKIHFREQET